MIHFIYYNGKSINFDSGNESSMKRYEKSGWKVEAITNLGEQLKRIHKQNKS